MPIQTVELSTLGPVLKTTYEAEPDTNAFSDEDKAKLNAVAQSASVFFYRADTSNIAQNDPGAGKIKWNHATQDQATALYVDWLTTDGFDSHLFFKLTPPPSLIVISDKDLAVFYQVWQMSGPVIEYADWFEVPVTFVEASASHQFSNNTNIAVSLLSR